jgi:hypothetical protein
MYPNASSGQAGVLIGQPAPPVGLAGIADQLGGVENRLAQLHQALIQKHMLLSGPQPIDASSEGKPIPGIRHALDRIYSLLTSVEIAVQNL